MSPAHRFVLKWARTAHVYLTLFGLALILFFAVTGFMLNHEDWFGLGEPRISNATGTLPTAMLNPVDRLGVVEALRNHHHASGAVKSFEEDEETVRVVFDRPGLRIEVQIQRTDGKLELTREAHGFAGIITDLHKGKSAGRTWGLVIDAVCIMLLIISTTGLVLWMSLRSRGKWGVLMMMLGTAISAAIYALAVP